MHACVINSHWSSYLHLLMKVSEGVDNFSLFISHWIRLSLTPNNDRASFAHTFPVLLAKLLSKCQTAWVRMGRRVTRRPIGSKLYWLCYYTPGFTLTCMWRKGYLEFVAAQRHVTEGVVAGIDGHNLNPGLPFVSRKKRHLETVKPATQTEFTEPPNLLL